MELRRSHKLGKKRIGEKGQKGGRRGDKKESDERAREEGRRMKA